MHLELLFAIIHRWLGRKRALVPCVVKSRNGAGYLLLLAICAITQTSSASVLTQGNVTPADNPFTTGVNEGLPSDGNFIDPFLVDPPGSTIPKKNAQINWEGRINPLVPTSNLNDDEIKVGISSFGSLVISGESILNDQMLTIGGSGLRNPTDTTPRAGSGIVRITGAGSVFNSDPSIVPPGLVDAGLDQSNISVLPRSPDGVGSKGNDLYIGIAGSSALTAAATNAPGGTGTLEISAGGRAEIQDAVILGRDPGSVGTLIVDGIDSYLGSGGFPTSSTATDLHSMVIGRQGTGTMVIQNGATVQTIAAQSSGTVADVAVSIGDSPFVIGTSQTIPQSVPGGNGTVTVDGAATKWVVGGTLQVGGFIDKSGGTVGGITDTDESGINSTLYYNNLAGQGTLRVQNGASIVMGLQPGATPDQNPPLFLAVGQNGRLQLAGGTITIGDVNNTGQTSRLDRTQIVNDGIIEGSGTIVTGVFRNRYLGRVVVSSGQSLTVYATSFVRATPQPTDFRPLNNWGSIQVLGNDQAPAMLDFERQSIPNTNGPNPPAPFFNWSVAPTAPGALRKDGIISCQSCVLRFGSGNAGDPANNVVGLKNYGILAFTGGSNYVTGNVLNAAASAALGTSAGIVDFFGPTTVTFEEDFSSVGIININGAPIINPLNRHSFITAGVMNITLDPKHLGAINSGGDAGISGTLNVTLTNVTPGSLFVGATFPIINVSGNLGGVNLTNPDAPTVDFTTPPHFTNSNLSSISLVPYGLSATDVLRVEYTAHAVSLIISAIGNASGPDFNGDGVVNSLDLAIWRAHVGTIGGATVLDGDANGDGRVDGKDFLIWQQNLGPYPGAGSGSSFGNNSAAVPEPTSVALVIMSALAWLPIRRRRAG